MHSKSKPAIVNAYKLFLLKIVCDLCAILICAVIYARIATNRPSTEAVGTVTLMTVTVTIVGGLGMETASRIEGAKQTQTAPEKTREMVGKETKAGMAGGG